MIPVARLQPRLGRRDYCTHHSARLESVRSDTGSLAGHFLALVRAQWHWKHLCRTHITSTASQSCTFILYFLSCMYHRETGNHQGRLERMFPRTRSLPGHGAVLPSLSRATKLTKIGQLKDHFTCIHPTQPSAPTIKSLSYDPTVRSIEG